MMNECQPDHLVQIAALNAMCKREPGFGSQVIRGRSKKRRTDPAAPAKLAPMPVISEDVAPTPPSPEADPPEVCILPLHL